MTPQTPSADGGFVRVPRSYLDLDVSPGAKTLLLHLCASANDDGESWHSYENIGKMIGRSKASVTSYVQELVSIGLVKAIEQKMANGYNYRRRLRLIQWRSLLSHWREMTENKKSNTYKKKQQATEDKSVKLSVTSEPLITHKSEASTKVLRPSTDPISASIDQSVERSVQNAECMDPSGPNKINKNKTTGADASVVWSNADEAKWRSFRPFDKDPIGTVNGPVPLEQVEKLQAIKQNLENEAQILTPKEANEAARTRLTAFCASQSLISNREALSEAVEGLTGIASTHASQEAAIKALAALWKPHWRKLPTRAQIEQSLSAAAKSAQPPKNTIAKIAEVTQRAWIAQFHLKKIPEEKRFGSAE